MRPDIEGLLQQLDELYQLGQNQQAANLLLDALKQWEDGPATQYALLANELAGVYRGISQFDASLHWFHAAMKRLEENDLRQSKQYATVVMNCAGAYRLMGNLPHAETQFLSAKALLEQLELTEDYVYTSTLNNLSLVYRAMGNLDQAEALGADALWRVRQLEGAEHEVATSLNNLAGIRLAREDLTGAEDLLDEALTLYDQMVQPNIHHSSALETRGVVRLRQGRAADALADFQRAQALVLTFSGENLEYAISCENIALLLHRLGRQEESILSQRQAVSLLEQLLPADHPRLQRSRQTLERLCADTGTS